jgi:hypothetical protein
MLTLRYIHADVPGIGKTFMTGLNKRAYNTRRY